MSRDTIRDTVADLACIPSVGVPCSVISSPAIDSNTKLQYPLVHGAFNDEFPLEVIPRMAKNGVIFSDGEEGGLRYEWSAGRPFWTDSSEADKIKSVC